jgi:hypothetical protein
MHLDRHLYVCRKARKININMKYCLLKRIAQVVGHTRIDAWQLSKKMIPSLCSRSRN